MEDYTPGALASIGFLMLFAYSVVETLWATLPRRGGGKSPSSFSHEYSQPLRNFTLTIFLSIMFPALGTAAFAFLGDSIAPFSIGTHWYSLVIGLVAYEFWYWVQHFLAHKVRLLWCLHSPHHAPDTINMVVGFNHHLLEVPYMSFFLGFMPAICGVPWEIIVAFNIFDGIWGSLLHASPQVIKKRYGPLEYFMQTPSFHRAHHARNPRYMDTNYNATTQLWDWIMGTRQVLDDAEPVQYGITRDVNVESWRDVQFGEFALLWRDVVAAPGVLDKIRYLGMPPGWSHTGEHSMASTQKLALGSSRVDLE